MASARPQDVAADSGLLSSVVWSVVRDKRNNRFEPSSGSYQSAAFETAGIGGDKKFLKFDLNTRYYKKLIGDLVFRNNMEAGQVFQVGSNPIPPLERYYLASPNNMRGFPGMTVSPHTYIADDAGVLRKYYLGGTSKLLAVGELEYPLIKEAGLKFVTFLEAGNTFEKFPGFGEMKFKSDWGVGIRWFSPIGPLRFEWGFPIGRLPEEGTSNFVFMIGPPF